MTDDQQRTLLAFLASQHLGVLATISERGTPQAALVGITETAELHIIFGTANTSRKYANIKRDPNVALVIGHDMDAGITVQYEGIAQELSGEASEKCRQAHLAKNPRAKKFAFANNQRWFLVTPTWIRFTNVGAKPPQLFEIQFLAEK